ncbi:SDR family oxidoreductase [Parahaliea mediterranea]|uniref:SDR family oxidoreductase n=1 Tax=Parahaliea mediterranea TaxID=651086 RepID=UPI000E2F9D58|nr:SDR family oxidoreductase [Parahaliea mediterranea]
MLLNNKVAIVSGIGPGLGQHLATHCAKEGAHVVLAARSADKLDAAEAAIASLGLNTRVLKVPTDIADPDACTALVAATCAHFGGVDVLLNSAYTGGEMTPVENANLADWRNTMDTNFFGSMQLTLAAVPSMKQRGGGAIVMVNTMVVRKAMAYNAGYSASKGALKTATAHLALELGQYGIRVNSAFMGWMWGPNVQGYVRQAAASQGVSEERVVEGIAQHIALRRIPTDANCAKAVIMLASDYASEVTGACLDVNGGDFIP